MAIPTAQAILDKIDTAIETLLGGGVISAWSIDGNDVTRYSLKELRELREHYQRLASAQASGGARNYVLFEDPK